MKLIAENIDIYPDTLLDIVCLLNDLLHKEDRSFEDNKRIRNILDDLDSFNMTLIIQDIDMINYSLLLSIDNLNVELEDQDELKFKNIDFGNDDLNNEYNRLIKQYKSFDEILNMPDTFMQYLQPNSRLVNVRISLSVKDFIYFILTCSKYDELLDLIVLISDFDTLLENLVTLSMAMCDMMNVEDLFIRMSLDEDNRKILLDEGSVNITMISNDEYISYCVENNKVDVKLSSIGTCSLVAYRDIVSQIPKHQIKIENFFDLINQEYISLILPKEYAEINADVANAIDGYIYDWYLLIDRLKKYRDSEMETMLCCLGCFSNIFKMNTSIENYFKMLYGSDLSEVSDIISVLVKKLIN